MFENYVKNLDSNWILIDLKEKENLLKDSVRKLRKIFKPYRDKYIFLNATDPEIAYSLALKLRKMGFKAYSVKNSEN